MFANNKMKEKKEKEKGEGEKEIYGLNVARRQ